MKRRLYIAVLLLISSMLSIVNAQNASMLAPSAERQSLMSHLEYGKLQDTSDTLTFDYAKSPGVAFLMSAILPGTGELYSGAYKRGLAFLGAEAIFWGGYFTQKNKGEDLEIKYKAFADNNWDFSEYLRQYDENQEYFNHHNSHHIYVAYGDNISGLYLVPESDKNKDENFTVMLENLGLTSDVNSILEFWDLSTKDTLLQVINDRDYYENIGKYDQFACGWGDFADTTDIVTVKRNNYLTQRKKSNAALKAATSFTTAIMFNHLLSALHAQIAAKQYRSGKEMSWNLAIITDVRYKQFVRGVNLSWAF